MSFPRSNLPQDPENLFSEMFGVADNPKPGNTSHEHDQREADTSASSPSIDAVTHGFEIEQDGYGA